MAARRFIDRMLVVATAASLLAAVLERRARQATPPTPIPSLPVDLAADPPERLRLLPGLGPTRLASLLRERERSGAPTAWGDLERIRGIGPKMLSAWRASGAMLGERGGADPPIGPAPTGPAPTGLSPTGLSPSGRPADPRTPDPPERLAPTGGPDPPPRPDPAPQESRAGRRGPRDAHGK